MDMLDISMNLERFRVDSAIKSGGTSPKEVKQFALKLIEPLDNIERVCDFGAGTGELLNLLKKKKPNLHFTGADILPRPHTLDPEINWYQQDLNSNLPADGHFDLVICSEVIEHLENPRQMFREINKVLNPKGWLVLTMPNQESYRSLLALWLAGNHVQFLGASYPAHITALVGQDLERICSETGFELKGIYYSGHGLIPKLTRLTWQGISFGFLRGKRFSDCMGMLARKT
jgi:2-polyprenyl-3-methyl-5-hydroxy-6-metoxy-1,4-benzoquinol methylase